MIDIVRQFLIKYSITKSTVIIACSGGADSCALVLLLNALKDEFDLDIVLAYFNHNWRKEAKDEVKFVKKLAEKFNNKFYTDEAPLDSLKTEEYARDLRYEFFFNASIKFNSKYVFLAHNKNDNVETLIYRIIKGTSIRGLTAIPENRDIYYRPLLNIEKSEILKYVNENNQDYVFDNSNDDVKYKRNLIRKEIIPLFEKINPKCLNSINNLILSAIEQRKIIENDIDRIKKEIYIDNKIDYYKYVELSIEYRLEILNDFIGSYLKYRDRNNLIKYDNFILNNLHSRASLNANTFLRTRWKKIFIENR